MNTGRLKWAFPRSSPNRFLVLLIVLIVLIFGTSSCVAGLPSSQSSVTPSATVPRDPGVMFGFNAQHTHVIPDEQILSASNVSGLVQAWTTGQIGTFFGASPIVVNEVVYMGSHDSKLYAYK